MLSQRTEPPMAQAGVYQCIVPKSQEQESNGIFAGVTDSGMIDESRMVSTALTVSEPR